MTNSEIVLVGRSSSHYTRTARLFALELGVPHAFRAVPDMMTLDPAAYAENPALKVPILLDARGPLFGSDNICRELARLSGRRDRVVLRGDVSERIVLNAEEMVAHAMSAEVTLIMTALENAHQPPPPKVRRSLENALLFLDATVDRVQAALPGDRVLSQYEAALFCLVTHLPFRKVMEVSAHHRLLSFCEGFALRAGAQATPYRFDPA